MIFLFICNQIDGFQSDIVEAGWHDILTRAHQRRSQLNKAIYAKKRLNYVRKMTDCKDITEKI